MKKNKKGVASSSNNRGPYLTRRIFAFGLDWYLSAVLANIAISLSYGFFNQGLIEVQYGFGNMSTPQCLIVLAVLLAIFLFYYVWIPTKIWIGQTPIQKLLHIKVVNEDGSNVSMKTMLFRFLVGCLLLEGTFYFYTATFKTVLLERFLPLDTGMMDFLLSGPIVVISVFSMYMAWRDKKTSQMLHDRISHTFVEDIYVQDGHQRAL